MESFGRLNISLTEIPITCKMKKKKKMTFAVNTTLELIYVKGLNCLHSLYLYYHSVKI